jgi:hypothetical protein
LPRYAFGAIPEIVVGPWSSMVAAAMPATWVAWNDCVGSNGFVAYL